MQFGLTLMCQGSSIRCARLLNEQLLTMSVDSTDDDKCLLHMFAAKLDIEQLAQYDSGIEHARQAIELCRGGWLTVRAKLLYALATRSVSMAVHSFTFDCSLKAQTLNSCSQRSALQRESLLLFEDAARSDPKDHLVELFWALQLAIGIIDLSLFLSVHVAVRDIDNARVHCQRSLELQSDEPAAIMLLALLLTADGGDKHALELVVDALDDYPKHYGLLVLRLKLEARFGSNQSFTVDLSSSIHRSSRSFSIDRA
jgi:tetratricopeptide (TPR) repeat protein